MPDLQKKPNQATIYTTNRQGVFANAGGESKGTEDTQDSDEEMSCCICMEEDDLPELEKFPCGHGFAKDVVPEWDSKTICESNNIMKGMSIQRIGKRRSQINTKIRHRNY